MYNIPIEIRAKSSVRDEYNERNDEWITVARCYAQRTEHGGRENLYASRIVHEQEVIYSIRYRPDLKAGMWVKEFDNERINEQMRKIVSIQEEGRRKILHLKTIATDAQD